MIMKFILFIAVDLRFGFTRRYFIYLLKRIHFCFATKVPDINNVIYPRLALPNKMADASKALFQFFDENNDGGISLPELKEAMAGVGVKFSEDEVTKFFNKVEIQNPANLNVIITIR